MSIDLSQFHGVFFEESFEGLEIMESELLELDFKDPGEEEINKIFRAAHSIKGGSGSFGFNNITNFTHVLETLLDEVRSDKHQLTQEEVNLLLTSVDCLRDMLSAARDKTDYDEAHVQTTHSELEKVLGAEPSNEAAEDAGEASDSAVTGTGWNIHFVPHHHLFQTGNDPLRMFRELEEYGELSSEINVDKFPPFDKYDVEECYVSWDLVLTSDVTEDQVKEVFEWVEDDCDLEITQIASNEVAETKNEESETKIVEVEQAEDRRAGDRRQTDRRNASKESSSIRVNTDKIDALINMVGELVITQSMLGQFGEEFDMKDIDKLSDGLKQLERNTIEEINKKLFYLLPTDRFLCACLIEIDFDNHAMKVWNAGLPDILVCESNGVVKHKLPSVHLPFGIVLIDSCDIIPIRINLEQGNRVYMYTDGLTEIFSPEGEMYGEQRLLTSIKSNSALDRRVEAIISETNTYSNNAPATDDVLLLEINCDTSRIKKNKKQKINSVEIEPMNWHLKFDLKMDVICKTNPIPVVIQAMVDIQGFGGHREKIFLVLTEMYSNAIEHGILELNSSIKDEDNGFLKYYEMRQTRLNELIEGEVSIDIEHHVEDEKGILSLTMDDGGVGFDYSGIVANLGKSGRGIALMYDLCRKCTYSNGGRTLNIEYEWQLGSAEKVA